MSTEPSNILDALPMVAPVDITSLQVLESAAAMDDHVVIDPTHIVIKAGQVVGYISARATVHWWMHSKKCGPRDSLAVMHALETLLRNHGLEEYVILCSANSPYHPLMQRMGYQHLGATHAYKRTI